MTKFIILTDKVCGKKIYVNPSVIQLIYKNQNSTGVNLFGDQYSYIEVSESPESIINLIQNVEEKNE